MVGTRLAHYRVLAEIGHGGMGVVYRAEDVNLHRVVALKLLPLRLAENSVARERLFREALAASKLSHPNIATIYEANEANGRLYVSMEYVDGESLLERMRRGPLTIDEISHLAAQIADALEAAHEAGVVHRDIKPSNILVGAGDRVKVVDFGLALEIHKPDADEATHDATSVSTEMVRLTRTGSAVGTIAYMSPEQARGETPDERSDLFSLGVVLYEMATGVLPFPGHTPLAMAAAIIHEPPVAPPADTPEWPAGLTRIIDACLSKEPEHRPAAAANVAEALRMLGSRRSTSSLARVLAVRRRRAGWPRVLGAVALVVVGVAVGSWLYRGSSPEVTASVRSSEARQALRQAQSYEARGNSAQSLEMTERMYRRAYELESDNPVLQGRLASFLASLENARPVGEARVREVRGLSDAAIAAAPELASGWIARSRLLRLEGDASGAVEAARRALAAPDCDFSGHLVLGEALAAGGSVEAGLAELRRAIDVGDGHVNARLALAQLLYADGRLDGAAAEFARVLEFAPDSPEALNNLGAIHLMRGNFVEAVRLLKNLMRLQPDDFAASNLGTAYFHLDRLDEAIDAYHEAVRLDPDFPVHKQNLAEAYEKAGDPAAAADWFERAIESFDESLEAVGPTLRPEILAERAFCEAKLGRHDAAWADASEALAAAPDNMVYLRSAARVRALAGDRRQTFDLIRRAVAAGYPGEELRRDQAFDAFRDDPEFLSTLTDLGN